MNYDIGFLMGIGLLNALLMIGSSPFLEPIEFSFPSTTILKLTKLFTMFEYERIYQEEEAPFYFRVIGLLGESLSKVLEVEQVVLKKEGKGRGNSILERVKGPPMALKVQTTEVSRVAISRGTISSGFRSPPGCIEEKQST